MKKGYEIKDQTGEKFWVIADKCELKGNNIKLYLEKSLVAAFWHITGIQIYEVSTVVANDGAE